MNGRLTLVMVLSLAVAACASVLGLGRASPAHPFEHRAHVTKGVSCVQCHSGMATAGERDRLHVPTVADCRSCHAKPHDERPCSGCHGEASSRGEAALIKSHLRFDHERHLASVKGDCVRCHVEIADSSSAGPSPRMATCFGCHQHEKQWTLRDCDGCHVDIAAEGTPPRSHLVHDGDWIREHGVRAASARDLCSSCHSERSCAACHGVSVPLLPAKLAFDEVPLTGLHRAGFRARHSDEAAANPGLCATCHSENYCVGCHNATGVGPSTAPRSPHPPGWVSGGGGGGHGSAARIDPVSCAGCHGGAGEQLCVGCHRVGGPGGNPHGPGFNSTKNEHHDMPCRMCHGVGP